MNLLVTLDSNYLFQLKVLLTSIYLNNPGIKCSIYLLYNRISKEDIADLEEYLQRIDYSLEAIYVDDHNFSDAPITDRYPKEMYYRLMASTLLPDNLEKVLYLDPDILVINSLLELWNLSMKDNLFAAAAHTGKTELANDVNRIRLGVETDYFNSGVLLMNLNECRNTIDSKDIYEYVNNFTNSLILPDQDVLNALYGNRILPLDDSYWNYDARNYSNYLLRSGGIKNMDWVMENTSILHFCGRDKPWKVAHRGRFGVLYKHYMTLTKRMSMK